MPFNRYLHIPLLYHCLVNRFLDVHIENVSFAPLGLIIFWWLTDFFDVNAMRVPLPHEMNKSPKVCMDQLFYEFKSREWFFVVSNLYSKKQITQIKPVDAMSCNEHLISIIFRKLRDFTWNAYHILRFSKHTHTKARYLWHLHLPVISC